MSGARKANMLGLALLGLMSTLWTAPAMAQQGSDNAQPKCSLVASASPAQWIIQHDPLTEGTAVGRFQLVVRNTGTGNCTVKIEADLNGESFGLRHATDTRILAYNLISESPNDDITPRTGRNANQLETSAKTIKQGETVNLSFLFEVPINQVLSAGLYSQQLTLNVVHPGNTMRDSVPVVLGINVRSGALMGLKGAVSRIDGLPTIDVGTLTEGERSLNTILYVISTSNYAVSVTSQNGGYLKQRNSEWSLPYSLTIGEHGLNLAQDYRWERMVSSSRQDEYPLSISVGSLVNRKAGTYSDVIRFTLSAL